MRETDAVGLVLPFGCLDDSIKGLNHFVEHLLFNSKIAKEFLEIFDSKGILYNGVTSYEYILFYCQGLKRDRQLMIDFCESLLSNFEITDEEFEKEKNIVLSEIDYYSQNKIEVISNMLVGNKDSHPILGSKESVSSITKSDIINYFEDIKSEFAVVNSEGEIRSNNKRIREKTPFNKNKKNLLKVANDVENSFNQYYGIGLSIGRGTSKYFKVFIDMISSALNDEFREKGGGTYRIHSNMVQTKSFIQNQFIFSLTNKIYYLEVIECIISIVERMKHDILNFSKIELEKYLERLETRSDIRLDNRLGRMKYNALKNVYMQNDEVENTLIEDDIKDVSLTMVVHNIDENDVIQNIKEIDVEFI